MFSLRRRRLEGGFTTIELIIVLAIVGMVALFAMAYLRSILKRERLKTVVREVSSMVRTTRAEAIQRHRTCVMLVDPPGRKVIVWAETPPDNYVQDAGEPTLEHFEMPPDVVFRLAPAGAAVGGPDAVSFDTYLGNPALVDRIVFKGDGTLDAPQAANSQRPLRPATYKTTVPAGSINCNPGQHCRGIYISDNSLTGDTPNRNTFRVSVDDFGSDGHPSILKWIPTASGGNAGEVNYVPPPWRWVD